MIVDAIVLASVVFGVAFAIYSQWRSNPTKWKELHDDVEELRNVPNPEQQQLSFTKLEE